MVETEAIEFDVVIVGGGFAGVYCARSLERALGRSKKIRCAIIAQENHMVFQPMLAEVAGGSLAPNHVVNPIRLLCRHTKVLKGTVESIDHANQTLWIDAGPLAGKLRVQYQHLVVTLGATIDLSRIPGMPEHALLMQNVGDAMILRSTIISRLEEANLEQVTEDRKRLLTFAVVGGGYSGVETAGQILDLVRGVADYYTGISLEDLHVVLIQSGDRLLPTLDPKLSDYCARVMRKRGLDVRLNVRVRAVTATQIFLDDETIIPTTTVVSTVGNAPHPTVQKLITDSNLGNERGRIVVDNNLRVNGHENLWSAGDCAAVPYVKGGLCPQTAQFAFRQGIAMGRNIAALLNNRKLKPFLFPGQGELASIGHRAAVARIFGINFSGFIAWIMWRTIYLMKLPRFDRKLRVVIDWTLDLFFPREIALVSPRYTKVLKEIHLETGDILFSAGEPAFSLYLVRSGMIELNDNEGVVSSHRRGDYFGERALLGDKRCMFTARAAEPTKLVTVPADVFKQIVGSGGSLGELFEKSAQRYQTRESVDSLSHRLPAAVLKLPVSAVMETTLTVFKCEQSVASAIATVREQPHSSYPVIDSNGRFAGLLRREDFHGFIRATPDPANAQLADIGIRNAPSAAPDSTVGEAVEKLIRSATNKLVIVDADQNLKGIVTVMDLVAASQRVG